MVTNQTDTDPKRFEDSLSLDDASIGDRIDPALIPRSPKIDVGEKIEPHLARLPDPDDSDERTFDVRLIASTGRYSDIKSALVYDPDAELFARLGGHTKSAAWNQREYDYKIRDIGHDIEIVDQWDVNIPDLEEFGETEEEFVDEWAEILFDNIRHGDDPGDEIDEFDSKTFRLRDYDGRRARVQYELE